MLIDNNVLFYRLPYVYLFVFVFVFVFIYVFFVYWLFYAKIVDFIIDDTGKLLLYFRALKLFRVLLCYRILLVYSFIGDLNWCADFDIRL